MAMRRSESNSDDVDAAAADAPVATARQRYLSSPQQVAASMCVAACARQYHDEATTRTIHEMPVGKSRRHDV